MIRNYCYNFEMNTITLSNYYLWSIKDCLKLGIEKVDKEIEEARKKGLSKGVIEVYENIKDNYQKMYYVLNEIAHETETQFNLDEMMKKEDLYDSKKV